MPVDASFQTTKNIRECELKKKKSIEKKDEYVPESVFNFGAWHEATARRDMRPFDSDIADH